MSVSWAKALLALVGLLVFFVGARWELAAVRWAGIALVAAAWLLRFYRRQAPTHSPLEPEDGR